MIKSVENDIVEFFIRKLDDSIVLQKNIITNDIGRNPKRKQESKGRK